MLLKHSTRVLLVFAVVGACSGTPDGDSGALDGAADMGIDGARDVGRDLGAADVGVDAQEVPDTGPLDPEWTRLPGFPDECYVEYASHPERVVSVEPRDCAPPLPTCTYGAIFPRTFSVMSNRATFNRDRHAWLYSLGLDEHGAGGQAIHTRAIVDSLGVCVAAVRATSADLDVASCHADLAAGPTTIAMRGDLFGESASVPRPFALLRGSIVDWQEHPLPSGELASLTYPASVQGFWSSDLATVSDIALGGYLLVSRGGAPTRRIDPAAAAIAEDVVGEHVFWSAYYDGPNVSRVYHSGADEADSLLLDGTASNREYRDLDVTDTAMTWYEVTAREPDGTISGGDLMVAEFATTAVDLHPRALRMGCVGAECLAPCLGSDAVAYTYIAEPGIVPTLDLLGLADGTRSRVTLPSSPRDWSFASSPIWVDDNEVAVPAIGPFGQVTLMRFLRSGFGPS